MDPTCQVQLPGAAVIVGLVLIYKYMLLCNHYMCCFALMPTVVSFSANRRMRTASCDALRLPMSAFVIRRPSQSE